MGGFDDDIRLKSSSELISMIEDLEKELDELKANSSELRYSLEGLMFRGVGIYEEIREVIDKSPRQSLEKMQSESFEAGFHAGWMNRHYDTDVDEDSTPSDAYDEFLYCRD